MIKRLALNYWRDWLEPGSPDDSRLLHSDSSDCILICPAHLGQGYFQEILLRDDLSLCIHDYILNQNLVMDIQSQGDLLEFEFNLAGPNAGYSFLIPYTGCKTFGLKQAQKRSFKVEVFFKRPTLITYLQACIELLSPQTRSIVERVIQSMYVYHGNGLSSTPIEILNQILDRSILPDPYFILEKVVTNALYTEVPDIGYATRSVVTPAMEQMIGQILSCPYQGATRRTYLERQALALVRLRLEAMTQPRLKDIELDRIYQAASILKKQVDNPPTVERLARLVGTNRLKLNQGFREVYGTTPFSYSRNNRLWHARRLLMTSDLPIEKVANAAGYTCRGKFAVAFRRQFGINPKAFQLQAWQGAS